LVRIMAVCGMGLGSGLMVRMQIEKVLKEAKIEASVEVSDISSARGFGQKIDIVVTSEDLAPQMGAIKAVIIPLRNLIDLNELRTKLLPAIQALPK
jgi:PTS system ascorbate-specific IIB component